MLALDVLAGDVPDVLFATHADAAVQLPQRQRDVETPERGKPGQRVLVVAVAQGAVDVENGRVNGSIDTRAVGLDIPFMNTLSAILLIASGLILIGTVVYARRKGVSGSDRAGRPRKAQPADRTAR